MQSHWRLLILLLAAIAFAACLPACSSSDDDGDAPTDPGDGGDPPDTTAPTVTMISPEDGSMGLEPWFTIFVQFSENIDMGVDPMTQVDMSVGDIDYAAWMDDSTLEIGLGDLPEATQVTLVLGTGFTDAAGNALAEPFTATYWTWSSTLSVLEHDPADGAMDVNRAIAIEVLFSAQVVPSSLETGAVIDDGTRAAVPFTVEELTNYRFRLRPDEPLPANSPVTVTLTTGIDSDWGSLVEDVVFGFTTGELLDDEPPTIVSFDPPSGATIPAGQTAITITFNEPIDHTDFAPSFLNGQLAWLLAQATQEPGFDMDGIVLTVPLPADLPAGLPLEARFADYADVNGNVQTDETTWTATIAGTADPYPVWDGRRGATGGEWAEGDLGSSTPTDEGDEMVWYEFTARATAGHWDKREYYDDWLSLDYYEIQAVSAARLELLGIAESDDGFTEHLASSPVTFVEFPLVQGNQWDDSATITVPEGTLSVEVAGTVVGQADLPYVFDGFEVVWTDVWQVRLDVELSVGGSTIGTDVTDYWVAPGVGVIREDYREENVDEGYWYEYDRWLLLDLD